MHKQCTPACGLTDVLKLKLLGLEMISGQKFKISVAEKSMINYRHDAQNKPVWRQWTCVECT